jgi:two-component system, chemotaxis family, chemotaxis protein CheY
MAFSVLIVDDSAVMRGFIRRVMALSGFEASECWEASDGEEALLRLREHPVDVILTDVNMPKMNGEEFLCRLETDVRLRDVPTLVISTDATKARILRMLSLGADGYITKPFSPEALREELERILGERHV